MNILKHGSKVVSVGLMALSMSAGFSGLAFARDADDPRITINPNPIVLDNTALVGNPNPGQYTGFTAVVTGSYLTSGSAYTLTTNFSCAQIVVTPPGGAPPVLSGTQVANADGRVSFGIAANGCNPGPFEVDLRQGTTTTDTIVAKARGNVLPPSPSGNEAPHHDTDDAPHHDADDAPHRNHARAPHQDSDDALLLGLLEAII